ncbi:MAG: glycoside hydrolase family 95 protein [Prevotella sp.]|nr:glycoside hydrolase family 95 protein [Prevotella sp.]
MRRQLLTIAIAAAAATAYAQQSPMQLWYTSPATFFEESLPLGNGHLGALVYGHPQNDIIQLNDITLWTGKPIDRQEDAGASRWITDIRKALFAEDYALADSLQRHVQGHNSSHYQPLGTLHITTPETLPVSNYRRTLSLDSALACVSYEQGGVSYKREYLVSAPDSVIAIHLSASKAGQLDLTLGLSTLLPHHVRVSPQQLTMMGHASGDPAESIHFCTIVRLQNQGGSVTTTDSTLVLEGASEATIWVVNATSFNGYDQHPVRQGAPYVEQANNRAWHTHNISYNKVRERHVSDHRKYFSRVCLKLSDEPSSLPTDSLLKIYNTGNTIADRYLETLYFQYGRYLLIACSRTPGVPANLQGLWNPHQWAPWRGNYTININLEENYWPAFCCNLAEMAMPMDGFLKALAENGRHTSRNYYGIARGWQAGHNSDIWAMANPVGEKNEMPEWANWAMGGAWLVETLWEKYLFTQDIDYLRQTAYPLMKGASEFMLEWLIPNPNKPEELITAPATSPENEYVNDKGYHGMTCYGSTADMAIIRELLINTLEASRLVGDNTIVDELQSALSRLHPYTIGSEGDLNEWYYDWRDYDPHHRHQSHLIGLYPGHHLNHAEVMSQQELDKIRTACEKTLVQKGDQTTGWSTGWRINLWARLHRADQAYHIYQKLLTYVSPDNYQGADRRRPGGGTYPNLMDAHPPFQIDGNFGGTAGVCEMLLQSSISAAGVTINLLPALPAQWADGEVKGLCARGGYEVSMQWHNGKVSQATISARKTGPVSIVCSGTTRTIKLKAGQQKHLKF